MSVSLKRVGERRMTVADLENGDFFCFSSGRYCSKEGHTQVWRKHQFNYFGQMIDVLINFRQTNKWTALEGRRNDIVIPLEAGDIITLTLEASDRC